MRPIKQRPWWIGLLSTFIVDRTLPQFGITPQGSSNFDRIAYDASSPTVPPFTGKSVLRADLEVPSADRSTSNGARLYTPVEMNAPTPLIIYCHGGGWVLGSPFK
jgi:acetyl esterase/lipase